LSSSLGRRIRKIREMKGLTQVELGRRFGCSQSAISNLERGRTSLRAEDVPQMARALGVSVVALFRDEKDCSLDEALDLFSSLPPKGKQEALNFMRFLHSRYAGAP